jgi:hypothetical protein
MVAAVEPADAQFFGSRNSDQQQSEPRIVRPRTRQPPQETRRYVPPPPEQRTRQPSFFDRLFPRLGMPAPQWSEQGQPRPPAPARPRPQRPSRPDATAGAGAATGAAARASSSSSAAGAAREQPPARRKVEASTFVAVLGDSLAENLAGGLSETLSEQPEVGLVREIRPGVGFLKPTDRSWKTIAEEVLNRQPPISAAVVFMGPMDDPVDRKNAKSDTGEAISAWTDVYAARVDDITMAFRMKGIPLLWVGLPPVEDARTSADNAFVNELVQQRVTAMGATFIDVWEGFVDEQTDSFTADGPNIEGRVVRLRTADGVHFTKAGASKLAHYVELELRPYLLPKEEGAALADVAKEIQAVPIQPGSSRILLLGEARRSPGAMLVPAANPAADQAMVSNEPAARSLKTGEALASRPGRADDFSWAAVP